MMTLISVPEAVARVLALGHLVDGESVPLTAALGRWAATDISARRTQPFADLSAMDGYAIRFADLPGPWRVIGESAAGRPFGGALAAGEAVRIFTGAALPAGGDTVMVQEEAARDEAELRLDGEGPPALGRNVRRRGLDFSSGDVIVRAGERLTAQRLALLAAAGWGDVRVRRRVRVALAATGDELAQPGSAGEALPESNRLMIAAQLAELPVETIDLGILPDDLDLLTAAFRAVDADVLVTTGGVSVGDHDLVRPALAAAGAAIDFWRIALRPGKPMMAGRIGETVALGLPGNPVSAFVTAELFLKPLVRHLSGAIDPMPQISVGRLAAGLPQNDHRQDYLRARRTPDGVVPTGLQDSGVLTSLAAADCLIVRPPHALAAQAGDLIDVIEIT